VRAATIRPALTDYLTGGPVDTVLLWASVGAMSPQRTAANVQTMLTRLAPLLEAGSAGDARSTVEPPLPHEHA
jgi:hypothetical protein